MHVFYLILFVGDGVHSVGLLETSSGLLEMLALIAPLLAWRSKLLMVVLVGLVVGFMGSFHKFVVLHRLFPTSTSSFL